MMFANLRSASGNEPQSPLLTMPPATANDMLLELLHKHGLSPEEDSGWIFPSLTSNCAIGAMWHPGETNGNLLIEVCSDEDVISELFVGIGAGDAGLSNAMMMFAMTDFHVMLAALWNHNDESQVTTHSWSIGSQRYEAFTGPITSRMSGADAPPIPPNMEAHLGKAVQAAHLTPGTHWFRFFFYNLNGEFTCEATHNNEEWAAGRDALKSLAWEQQDGFYTMRMFMMLRPTAELPGAAA